MLQKIITDSVTPPVVIIERLSPRRNVLIGEEGRECGYIRALGAKMIVYDINDHCYSFRMSGVDQLPELIHTAIGRLDRERVDAVVTPVAVPRELRKRHQ